MRFVLLPKHSIETLLRDLMHGASWLVYNEGGIMRFRSLFALGLSLFSAHSALALGPGWESPEAVIQTTDWAISRRALDVFSYGLTGEASSKWGDQNGMDLLNTKLLLINLYSHSTRLWELKPKDFKATYVNTLAQKKKLFGTYDVYAYRIFARRHVDARYEASSGHLDGEWASFIDVEIECKYNRSNVASEFIGKCLISKITDPDNCWVDTFGTSAKLVCEH